MRELIGLLGDIDDAAVVVVAGNLFHPEPTSDLVKFIDATLTALPELRDALRRLLRSTNGTDLVVLPGSRRRRAARPRPRASAHRRAWRRHSRVISCCRSRRRAACATSPSLPGTYALDVAPVNVEGPRRRASARRPTRACRASSPRASSIAGSAAGCGFPIAIFVLADLWSAAVAVVGHLSHHRYTRRVLARPQGFWVNLVVDLADCGGRRDRARGAGRTPGPPAVPATRARRWCRAQRTARANPRRRRRRARVRAPGRRTRRCGGRRRRRAPTRAWRSSTVASAPRPALRARCSSNDGAASASRRSSPPSTDSASSRSKRRARVQVRLVRRRVTRGVAGRLLEEPSWRAPDASRAPKATTTVGSWPSRSVLPAHGRTVERPTSPARGAAMDQRTRVPRRTSQRGRYDGSAVAQPPAPGAPRYCPSKS